MPEDLGTEASFVRPRDHRPFLVASPTYLRQKRLHPPHTHRLHLLNHCGDATHQAAPPGGYLACSTRINSVQQRCCGAFALVLCEREGCTDGHATFCFLRAL